MSHGRARGKLVPVRATLLIAALGTLVRPADVHAQGYRGWVASTARYLEARPVRLDTVAADQVVQVGSRRFEFQGTPVSCVSGAEACTLYRPESVDHAFFLSQDASVTLWGFGVQGLSVTALARGRAKVSGDFEWPRSDDDFDVILAYVQWVRGPVRLRVGRQRTLSGLGFSGYDGGTLLWTPLRELAVEVYGGRSLARGLVEPRDEALRGIESFVLDQSAHLFGGSVRGEPWAGTSLTARYQREIWSDRSGLLSERGSLDLKSSASRARIDASLDYDFGFGQVGKGHLTVRWPFLNRRLAVDASVRRYVPYFELSTIWGFFSPVAYHEAELRLAATPRPGLGVWLSGGYRSYEDSDAQGFLGSVEDDGRRVAAGVNWRHLDWSFDGRYTLEWGPGSFLSAGDARVSRRVLERLVVGLSGTAFQRIEEFRIGEGMVAGGGGFVELELPGGGWLDGGLHVYRHRPEGQSVDQDWSQLRAWTTLRFQIGDDPGRRREGGGS